MWPRVGGCSSLGWARKVGKPVARICRQFSGADSEWLILRGEERKGKGRWKRREERRKETRNGQKDNIESRGSERGEEIPEKSPGIDGQDDADQSPGFVSRSPDPKPIRVFPSPRQRYFIT